MAPIISPAGTQATENKQNQLSFVICESVIPKYVKKAFIGKKLLQKTECFTIPLEMKIISK